MPRDSTSPRTERVHCNGCGQKTMHRVTGHVSEGDSDEERGYWWTRNNDMLQCCGCEDVVLRKSYMFSENEEADVSFHPPVKSRSVPKWQYFLPKAQRQVLKEIYAALDAESVRLPMMGARTLIDMLMLDKVGDVGGFQDKLKKLVTNGFLSTQNRDVLDAALEAGNAASHRGHLPSGMEVRSVMDIVENMLQAAYVFPKVAQDLRKLTPGRPPKKSI